MARKNKLAGIVCAALIFITSQPAAAREDLTAGNTLQTKLWEVRLEALGNDEASGKTASGYRDGSLDIEQYYREASLLELEAAELCDRTAALEQELYEFGEPAGAVKSMLSDAQSRRGRNERRRAANQTAFENGHYITDRKYYIELLPLAREAHAIAAEEAMLRWQAANWKDSDYNAENGKYWEARYLQYGNRRDLTALEYGQQAGKLTREKALALRKQLETRGRQIQNLLDEAAKALERRGNQKSGVVREFDYNDYHRVVTRLEEIEDALKRLEWKWEDRSIPYSDYKESKKALEREREDLRSEKRGFGYNDDLH